MWPNITFAEPSQEDTQPFEFLFSIKSRTSCLKKTMYFTFSLSEFQTFDTSLSLTALSPFLFLVLTYDEQVVYGDRVLGNFEEPMT